MIDAAVTEAGQYALLLEVCAPPSRSYSQLLPCAQMPLAHGTFKPTQKVRKD